MLFFLLEQKRNGNETFSIAYHKYWEERNLEKSKETVAHEQQNAIQRMNQIICGNLVALTEQVLRAYFKLLLLHYGNKAPTLCFLFAELHYVAVHFAIKSAR